MRIGHIVLLLVASSTTIPQVVHAGPWSAAVAISADSSVSGTGRSRWGPIPEAGDTNLVAFSNRRRSAWEWPLIVPYSVVNLPLRYLRLGAGALVIAADRHDLFGLINIVPVPRGLVPTADYGSESGLTLGINYYFYFRDRRNPFRFRAQYSTKDWQKYTLGAAINRGGRWELHYGGGYQLRPNLRFFGVGPGSSQDDRAFYKDERGWVGANLRRNITENSVAAFLVAYSSVGARSPDLGNDPALTADMAPPGFGESSQGMMFRLAMERNSASNQGNPEDGSILGGTVGAFASSSDDVSFFTYRLEVQKFLPLWHSRRALALRGYINYIDDQGSDPVPFQRMFINEMPDQFRGYISGRWRDLGITGVTAEYRFPFIADRKDGGFGIDTVLFTDVGQVFSDFDQIKVDSMTASYGFGWRAYLGDSFVGAMEFAWSEEGFQFRLSTKQVFQFSREVLLNGREETLVH